MKKALRSDGRWNLSFTFTLQPNYYIVSPLKREENKIYNPWKKTNLQFVVIDHFLDPGKGEEDGFLLFELDRAIRS